MVVLPAKDGFLELPKKVTCDWVAKIRIPHEISLFPIIFLERSQSYAKSV